MADPVADDFAFIRARQIELYPQTNAPKQPEIPTDAEKARADFLREAHAQAAAGETPFAVQPDDGCYFWGHVIAFMQEEE